MRDEELVGWGKVIVCHHSPSFTSDKHEELLILSWPTSSKLHASEMKWLLAYLTFIWAQAANIAGIVHWCIPKRDRAPCAAKTEMEGLASPKLPSGGLRLSQGCLAPWVSSPEVWQKKLLGELTYPFLFTLPLLYNLSSLLAFCLQGSPSSLCLCDCVAVSSKDNSVVLHTSSSASTVQTGGRGDVAWRALGARSVQSTTHGSHTRGGSSVQSRSPGRISAIRWRR